MGSCMMTKTIIVTCLEERSSIVLPVLPLSTPVTLASLWFLEHSRPAPALGHWYLIFLFSSPRTSMAPYITSFPEMSPFQTGTPLLCYLKSPLHHYHLVPSSFPCCPFPCHSSLITANILHHSLTYRACISLPIPEARIWVCWFTDPSFIQRIPNTINII